jgi:PAS domain S-box-containing protein
MNVEQGEDIFIGDGEMSRLMKEYDWESTSLGPTHTWPESLKVALRIILRSAYPMFIWWGKDLIMFNNDAHLPVLGKKHPESLGNSAKKAWAEIWDDIETFVTAVFEGETMFARDLELYLERLGFPEETYWTFSYSPIINDKGEVEGLFCACNEETSKILQQRRFNTLMSLSALPTRNTTVFDMLHGAIEAISQNPNCIPFAGIYVVNHDRETAYLHAHCGLVEDQEVFAPSIAVNQSSPWGFNRIMAGEEYILVEDLPEHLVIPRRDGDLVARKAVITPISKVGTDEVAAILVCAISPYLVYNSTYADFIRLLSATISKAKADIRSHEIALEQAQILKRAAAAKADYLEKIELEKEKLKAIIMKAPIAMCFLKGPNMVFEIANDSYLTLVGKARYELELKPLAEVLPETSNQAIGEVLKNVYTKGETFVGEEFPIEINRPNKPTTGYYTFVYEPMRNLRGQVHGIMVVAIEVTDQVLARKAIEKQEQYFRDMANNVPVMVWMTDTRGFCSYLNQQWLAYTGQTFEEGMGMGWLEAVHEEDREMSERIFLGALKREESFEITYRLKDANGKYRWHIDAGMPRYDEKGKFDGFTGAVINIHERKTAEDALRKSENELSSAISATNLGTWVYYPLTGKINFSTRSKALFGLPPEAYVDYEIFESGLHKDDLERTRTAVLAAIDPEVRKPYDIEYRTVGLVDGKTRWVRATGQVYFNENDVGDLFIGTLLDITNRKALEKQKDDFLAISSHELKTPVTSIKGYVQMLIEEFEDKRDAEAVSQLHIVNRQVDKLIGLINELLDTSKLETGQMQLNMEVFDVDTLVDEVVHSMQHLSAEHKLNLNGRTHKKMLGDRNRMEQVLTNLISNAVKFSPGAKKVDITTGCEGNTIRISVEDYGVGMEPENANRVFERFYRAAHTSHWSTGLGLGLFISSEIVKRHNGTLSVNSKLNVGTKFCVKLPCSNQSE